MPEGIPYASSNVVAGTGPTFQYIGNRIFGYSGSIGIGQPEKTLFEDKVGSRYAIVKIQFNYIENSTDDVEYFAYINDVLVQGYIVSGDILYTDPDHHIELLIPPFNTLKLSAFNHGSGTERDQIVSVVGKLYK